jgi:predicted nucleic acid-binding protein
MAYLIDSDWIVEHLANSDEANQLLSQLSEDGIAISIITYIEMYQGVLRSPDPKEAERKLQTFVDAVSVLSISAAVARRCAHIRETLRKQGKEFRRRVFDLLIAATALEHNLTLVTRNRANYADGPNIRFYHYSA